MPWASRQTQSIYEMNVIEYMIVIRFGVAYQFFFWQSASHHYRVNPRPLIQTTNNPHDFVDGIQAYSRSFVLRDLREVLHRTCQATEALILVASQVHKSSLTNGRLKSDNVLFNTSVPPPDSNLEKCWRRSRNISTYWIDVSLAAGKLGMQERCIPDEDKGPMY